LKLNGCLGACRKEFSFREYATHKWQNFTYLEEKGNAHSFHVVQGGEHAAVENPDGVLDRGGGVSQSVPLRDGDCDTVLSD
jgi:hypothetical protein